MQSEETVSHTAVPGKIVDIGSLGGRKAAAGKQQRKIQRMDAKFASLDERLQRVILSYMIGYLEAAKDLISSGRQADPDVVSSVFGVMEDVINKSWNGGML